MLNSIKKECTSIVMCNFFVLVGNLTLVIILLNNNSRCVDLSGARLRISPAARCGWPDTLFIPDRRSNTRFFTRSKRGMSSRDRRHSQRLSRNPSIFTGFD